VPWCPAEQAQKSQITETVRAHLVKCWIIIYKFLHILLYKLIHISVWRGVPKHVLHVERLFCAHCWKTGIASIYCWRILQKTWATLCVLGCNWGIRLAMVSLGGWLRGSQIAEERVSMGKRSRYRGEEWPVGKVGQKRHWKELSYSLWYQGDLLGKLRWSPVLCSHSFSDFQKELNLWP
jgi:hypothetical protein